MEPRGLSPAQGSDRARKRARRGARGVKLVERDGYWHAYGTLRAGDRSIRVRRSLGLPIARVGRREAETALEEYLDEVKARALGKVGRGDPVGIAAAAYLGLERERPLGASTIRIVKELVARFGTRRLNDIASHEWAGWIDGSLERPGRMTGRAAGTRERFLNGILGLLGFCREHHGLAAVPKFPRDKRARNPNRRARRRVEDLRPDLIAKLFQSAHIALRAQLAVEWSTGARVSSILYGVRVCDLVLAKGREQIVFRGTKNGEDVAAALAPSAVAILKDYVAWRGKLQDREAPLFLTPRREPYADNGKAWGGQNKTAFRAARMRAARSILADAESSAAKLASAGRRKAAAELRARAAADAALIGRMTQHWFRHLLATKMLRQDPRAAMEQGGWLDIRSVIGYSHDVQEHRRRIVAGMDDLDTFLTRNTGRKAQKTR